MSPERRVAVQRHRLDQRAIADHDAGRVFRDVAREPFELARGLEQASHLPVRFDAGAQFGRLLMRLLERRAERLGDQLRDAVDVGVGHTERAADIAQRRLRLQRPEADDLRDAHLVGRRLRGAVVLLGDVADHRVAPAHAEVDVDVRHRDAFGVEEALEEDVVLDRVDAGDAEAVGDQASRRRTASRADRHTGTSRVVDEVRHDQEVAGEAHRLDHRQLVLHARAVDAVVAGQRFVALEAEAPAQPRPGHLLQHLLAGRAGGHLEIGQLVLAHLQFDVAALGDFQRRRDGGRVVVEDLPHLVAVLHVETLAVEVEALRIVEVGGRADAEQHVVRLVVVGFEIVGVVGCDQREVQIGGHLHQLGVHLVLRGNPVALQLQVEAALEERRELLDEAPGARGVVVEDRARHHRRETARRRDQPFAVLAQQIEVDARLVVEALEIAPRHQHHQIAVAGVVHREQQQVVDRVEARVVLLAALPFEARAGCEVDLAAEDRLHARVARLLVELDGAEEIAVVGHRDSRHAERLGAREERLVLDRTVEERELRVEMQVGEGSRHPPCYSHSMVAGGFDETS